MIAMYVYCSSEWLVVHLSSVFTTIDVVARRSTIKHLASVICEDMCVVITVSTMPQASRSSPIAKKQTCNV